MGLGSAPVKYVIEASLLAPSELRVRLEALAWEPSRIDTVASAIESHSFSAGVAPTSIEGCILQDADRLDAIGLSGATRCFYTRSSGLASVSFSRSRGKNTPTG